MTAMIVEREEATNSTWAVELAISTRRGAVRLDVKSQEFEDYFRALAEGVEKAGGSPTVKLGQVTAYNWMNGQKPSVGSAPVVWNDLEQPLFNPANGTVNLTWLRAVGLGKGVTVHFTMPMTRAMLNNTRDTLEKVLKELYEAHIAEREVILRMKSVYEQRG